MLLLLVDFLQLIPTNSYLIWTVNLVKQHFRIYIF